MKIINNLDSNKETTSKLKHTNSQTSRQNRRLKDVRMEEIRKLKFRSMKMKKKKMNENKETSSKFKH